MKRLKLDLEKTFKVTSPRTRAPGESCSTSPSCRTQPWHA
jgi:hypothetical protein